MYFKNVYRRLSSVNILILLVVGLWVTPGFAQIRVGLDYSSLQEKRSSTEISSVGRSFVDMYFNIALKRESPLYLTLGYLNITSIENYDDSTYTKIISTNPYIGLAYHFWSKKSAGLIVGGYYSPYAKLGISDETGKETWNGKTTITKVVGTISLSAKIKLNAGLYYISDSYDERASGNVTTESKFGQSYLAPLIGVAVAF